MAKQFLFIGDSLIEFFNWQNRFPGDKVYNFGAAGETAEGLYARLPGITRRLASPDLVMIMTGTNNIAMEDYTFLITYEKIIDLLQNAYNQTTIVMTSLLPMDFFFLGDAVFRVNKKLQHIAQSKNIVFLDLYPLFLDKNSKPVAAYYEPDGVHLSQEGYEIWAKALVDRIFPSLV
ncbi:MAG: GDSL-type esterase/lipase family protein [Desulfobulbales bacterium]|nr:GDSL-type esterase/lipase family protein [Desulfobulbales bacterium]